MSDDFVTRLRLQLREAALREERRAPVARRVVHARRRLPGPAPVAAALAMALIALAVGIGAVTLRGEPQPATPKVLDTFPVVDPFDFIRADLVGRRAGRLVSGFGAAWTTGVPLDARPPQPPFEIVRIDPAGRRVVSRIPVQCPSPCPRDGGFRDDLLVRAGAGAVWALSGDLPAGRAELLRLDPDSGRVVARIPVRAPSGARLGTVDLQFDGDVAWIVGTSGAVRIDTVRNVPDRYFGLSERGDATRGVVLEGDRAWMLTSDDRLREFETIRGQLISEVPVGATGAPGRSRLFGGRPGTLTLVNRDRFAVIERATGRTLWERTLEGWVRHWTADGDTLWLHVARAPEAYDRLVRLDAGSGRRLGHVDLRTPGTVGVAKVGDEIWVANPDGEIVVVRP